MAEPLDPLRLPLHGSRLIEASAGTGKTWTIAALYLRLVLGHQLPQVRLPGEILVMTFTRAATRELSDRIRARLVEAAACFRGEREPAAGDALLAALLADFPAGDERSAAAWRLAMAAEAMDEAAIHTIDAWCQRMLREHAFDSGCLFDEELAADEAALLRQAVHDYWRQQVYPLNGAALALVTRTFPGVDALRAAVQELLGKPLPDDAGRGELAELLPRLADERARALATLREGWPARVQAMRDWLAARWADKTLDGVKLAARHANPWLDALAAWAASDEDTLPVLNKGRERLLPAHLRVALKDPRIEPPPIFAQFEALMQALDALPTAGLALRAHAARRIAERVRVLKAQAGRFGFADMLERLDAALDEDVHGERARRLRERIVAQYPVAMIDEFQDTSPVQLRIFDRLYRIAADDPATTLLLIGDPKQAIYGFRGADIHSYLVARRDTAGRHHVLTTNFRSTAPLVEAVNRVFSIAEAREGDGAFGFRRPGEAAGEGGLPFVDVGSRGRDEVLRVQGAPLPPLTLVLDPMLRGAPDSRERFAALCAERIVALLADASAGFDDPQRGFTRLRPGHVAVLVRTGTEAAAVRRALRRRGVASVYLSDKDSVYASDEARDLLRLLQAAASPRDVRSVRAALATALIGLDLAELLRLAADDEAFDAQAERFAALQRVWQQQGVLAMIRRALQLFELPARWLAADGERALTNLLHLAELLQADSAQLDGEQALIRVFAQQIDEAAGRAGAAEEQVLRLESDADLVQVVTVHKSKGLEYPLVFLPFAAHVRSGSRKPGHVHAADEDGTRRLVLAPRDEDHERAERERLREDLRLLYVALTRARHALWVGAAALKQHPARSCGWHRSALGRLVSGTAECDADAMADAVRAWADQVPGLRLEEAPDTTPLPVTRWAGEQDAPPLQPAAPYAARFDRSWAIGSYSALVKDLRADDSAGVAPEPAGRALRDDDEPAEADSAPVVPMAAAAPWHRFPRGAFAGDFLHQQLEWLAGEGFALDASPALQQALRRRCERQGWGHRADDVIAWLTEVCRTPLPGLVGVPALPLAGLQRVLPEMEFWFPAERLPAREVDALCRAHLLPGRARPALPERTLHGMLMGFADLVFEHHGRYGVLDHKSNALGPRDADYRRAAMEEAMLVHRYDVQAALYLLALHRLLRARLGAAYRPAEQLHGAVYLFLRGIAADGGGALHVAPPWPLLDALDTLLDTPRVATTEGAP